MCVDHCAKCDEYKVQLDIVPASSGLESRGRDRNTQKEFLKVLIRIIWVAKDMCCIRSQKSDDNHLGKLNREEDFSKHVHSYDIIYYSQHSFKMG